MPMPSASASWGPPKRHVGTLDDYLTGIRWDEAKEDVHQSRLPGSVLSEKSVDLATFEFEIDVAVSDRRAIRLGDGAHEHPASDRELALAVGSWVGRAGYRAHVMAIRSWAS